EGSAKLWRRLQRGHNSAASCGLTRRLARMSDGAESDPVHDDALQVGAWRVEFPLHRLASGDRIVKLEPKSTALLRYLAERPGQVVSRELLLSAVWPGVVV